MLKLFFVYCWFTITNGKINQQWKHEMSPRRMPLMRSVLLDNRRLNQSELLSKSSIDLSLLTDYDLNIEQIQKPIEIKTNLHQREQTNVERINKRNIQNSFETNGFRWIISIFGYCSIVIVFLLIAFGITRFSRTEIRSSIIDKTDHLNSFDNDDDGDDKKSIKRKKKRKRKNNKRQVKSQSKNALIFISDDSSVSIKRKHHHDNNKDKRQQKHHYNSSKIATNLNDIDANHHFLNELTSTQSKWINNEEEFTKNTLNRSDNSDKLIYVYKTNRLNPNFNQSSSSLHKTIPKMMLKSNEKVNNLPIELEAENGTEILFQSKNYESINGMNQKISFETDDIGKSNLDCQQQRMLRKQTIGQMIQSDNVQSCRRRASNEKHNDCMKGILVFI